jgi:hypothetical protein
MKTNALLLLILIWATQALFAQLTYIPMPAAMI